MPIGALSLATSTHHAEWAASTPQFLVNPVNSLLDSIQDGEGAKAAKVYGTPHTVESAFRGPREHWEEHKADILKALGRA